MDVRLLKQSQVVDWKYLPEIGTIFQYLKLADLKEFSMSCKRYRNKLESRILENLYLDGTHDYRHFEECYQYMGNANDSEALLDAMEEDLKDKYQLVKGITIYYDYENEHFAKKVIGLFPHITKLKIRYENYDGTDGMDILAIFKGMKYVEHIEFSNYKQCLPSFYTFNEHIFSKSLKSLIINVCVPDTEFLTIFDTIDSSYVNLTKITIASNKMLANLTSNMSNLADVKLLNNGELDNDLILEFLKKNPQLKHLELCSIKYTQKLFNTILSSNCLSDLIIGDSYTHGLEINSDFRLNYSIKRLKIDYESCSVISNFIKSCKNLESVLFDNISFNEENKVIWDSFNRRVKSLKLYHCNFRDCDSHIQAIDKLNLFNQVIFVSYQFGGNIVQLSSLDKLSNYTLLPNIAEDKYSYSIKNTIKRIKNDRLIYITSNNII